MEHWAQQPDLWNADVLIATIMTRSFRISLHDLMKKVSFFRFAVSLATNPTKSALLLSDHKFQPYDQ